MALSPDIKSGLFRELSKNNPTLPQSGLIFDSMDPRLNDMSRKERQTQYYARELAAGNLTEDNLGYELIHGFVVSDEDSQDPSKDVLVTDPLSDPRVKELADQLRAAGFKKDFYLDIDTGPIS